MALVNEDYSNLKSKALITLAKSGSDVLYSLKCWTTDGIQYAEQGTIDLTALQANINLLQSRLDSLKALQADCIKL